LSSPVCPTEPAGRCPPDTPGTYVLQAGPLAQAVQSGRWLVIEDIAQAPRGGPPTSPLHSVRISSTPPGRYTVCPFCQ